MAEHDARHADELIPGFRPENDLERALVEDHDVRRGLAWGRPRKGHPEGSVGRHVADLLERVERSGEPEPLRSRLRFVTLVHDALKFRVMERLPHVGPNHHGARARKAAERYTDDEALLSTVELHDRPYGIWRRMRRTGHDQTARLDRLVAKIADPELFLRFVELDGSTEGKDPEPVRWFRRELERRGAGPPD